MIPDTTVCIIDDDPAVRRALQRLLTLVGYQVEAFASSDDFLRRSSTVRIDCLVLDVRMPGISGLALCEILARAGRQIPTVLMTGEHDPATALHAIQVGAIDLLIKPLDVDVLCETVARAVRTLASRKVRPAYHGVLFYKDDRSLAATVAEFLDEGMRIGQPALVIATPAHAAAIADRLRALGHDIEALENTGSLRVLDGRAMLRTFMTQGMPDPLLFRNNAGTMLERLFEGRPVRVYGEGVDLLWQDGLRDGALKLESLWEQLAGEYRLTTLCAYSIRHFATATPRDSIYRNVCAVHSHVRPATLTWA